MILLIALKGNQIGAAGATQLADALQRNSTLTTLEGIIMHDHNVISTPLFLMFLSLLFCVGNFGRKEEKRVARLLKRNKQTATKRRVCNGMMVTVW